MESTCWKRNLENYPVHGINIAAREVSGDFFSFYPHNDSIYFIIADVAGKGIHAGMVMAKASTLFEIAGQKRPAMTARLLITHLAPDDRGILFVAPMGEACTPSLINNPK